MSERFTPEARAAVLMAHLTARISLSGKIEAEHLLIGIMRENPGFFNRFLTAKVTGDPFLEALQQNSARGEDAFKATTMPQRSEECERVIAFAAQEAERAGQENIGIDHLVIAILREESSAAARMLCERGADIDLIRFHLAAGPYVPPSQRELKLRALNRMVNILDNSHPSESAKIAEIRNRLELSDGEDTSDLSDQMMEIMADSQKKPRSSNLMTEKVRRLLFFAQFEAKRTRSSEVESGHLLLVILREQKKHLSLFTPLANSTETICTEIKEALRPAEGVLVPDALSAEASPPLSEECKRAQAHAREEADRLWSSRVGPEHLLLGLLREEGSFAARILRKYGAEAEKIREGLAASPDPGGASSNELLQ